MNISIPIVKGDFDIRDFLFRDHNVMARILSSKVDLRTPQCIIENQRTLASCSGDAITSQLEITRNLNGLPYEELSPMYIWYKGREKIGKVNENCGLVISNVLSVLL